MTVQIMPFILGDYQTNCYVVTSGEDCWVVDCGYSPDELIQHLQSESLQPSAVLLTHCHADHIAGLDQLTSVIGNVPVLCHESEAEWNMNPMLNLSGLAGMPVTAEPPSGFLTPGKQITLGDSIWQVVHVPGHSPGSISFVHEESQQAIVGDTLFAGSIGRFDFPTSNVEDLRHSISEVLMKFPDDMTIYPGHGPSTTIGQERQTNQFVIHGF
jgi:glyoxylase-like metal-dependent hydrolase (beta-lactamase superfamily II)